MTTTLSQAANDRRAGMNLGELRRFIQATAQLDDTAAIHAVVGWRGQLGHIDATGDTAAGREVHKPFRPVRIDRW